MRKTCLLVALLLIPAVSAQSSKDSGGQGLDPRNYIEIQSSAGQQNQTDFFDTERGLDLPLSYVALLLAILGIGVYSLDVDPFFLVLLILGITFAGVFYYAGIPIPVMVALVAVLLGVKYFR